MQILQLVDAEIITTQVQKVKNYVKVVTLTFRWEDRKQ